MAISTHSASDSVLHTDKSFGRYAQRGGVEADWLLYKAATTACQETN